MTPDVYNETNKNINRKPSNYLSDSAIDFNKNGLDKAARQKQKEDDIMRTTTKTNITSLYELPIDKPLGIDMQKFLQPDPFSKYEGNDLEIILEALKQNKVVEEVLSKR